MILRLWTANAEFMRRCLEFFDLPHECVCRVVFIGQQGFCFREFGFEFVTMPDLVCRPFRLVFYKPVERYGISRYVFVLSSFTQPYSWNFFSSSCIVFLVQV